MLFDEPFCADHLRASEIRLLLAAGAYDEPRPLQEELSRIEAAVEARLADPSFDHPAGWLRTRLAMTATEEHVVWLLIGCELVPRLRVLARQLATEQLLEPTIDVVRRVIHGGATARACREVHPEGRLFDLRIVECADAGPASRIPLRISDRMIALAHGDTRLDAELSGLRVERACCAAADLVVDHRAIAEVAATLSGARDAVTLIAGGRGTGRRSLVQACAERLGRELIVIEGARIAKAEAAVLQTLAREARLLDRPVLLRNIDSVEDATLTAIDRWLVGCTTLFVTASEPVRLDWQRRVVTLELKPLREEQRARIWERAFPELASSTAQTLGARHAVAPGLIHAAAKHVRSTSRVVDDAAVATGLRLAIDDGLTRYAKRVDTTQSWSDLVIPDDQVQAITELVARASHREHVYERWGFGAKIGRGLGVSALFSGPPGTGKTMIAGLIAKELGLQCYQVDLSRMASKWLGDTEKNLSALFDGAEAAQAVLLFDEADSLFGKRTQVTSANDRYANLEVNYLLQRMESFTGISVLTTNHEQAIDDAFRRRLSLHIRFSVPDVDERERIWRALIPGAAQIDAALDFRSVATRFAMSGGYIKNAMLRAAFLAAAESSAIGMRHVEYAAHVEYEGMGKLVPHD